MEVFKLIKGTRMIVITKNKIIKVLSILVLFCVISVLFIFLVNGINIPAFSEYESIINNELVPVTEEREQQNIKKGSEERLLQKFFAFSNKKPVKKEENEKQIKIENETILKSESIKIDKGLKVSDATGYAVNPVDFINQKLAFDIDTNGPQVLIMHTHTTESFSEETYIKGAPDRNIDENKNITAVGNAMSEVFSANGINVIHDKTVHDYPSYNSAYQSAAATINKNLNMYKGIKVVLDIHRDGITRDDGTKVKLVTDINGEKTAQIMLVVGTDVNLEHKNWKENFKFASKIQAKAVEVYPSLMRPIDLRKERFNEQLTTGSLIIEVGSNGNTMEEAIRGGKMIAEVISGVLKEE